MLEEAVSLGNLEGVPFDRIAENYGTPCYVYSAEAIARACKSCTDSANRINAKLRYAIKANGNVGLLREIQSHGFGFDASSRLEMERALRAGASYDELQLTGPGKARLEIDYAVQHTIGEIICESDSELTIISECAKKHNIEINVGVRVNPDVDANTHPHITTGKGGSKFGVAPEELEGLFKRIQGDDCLRPGSLHCHIGSQISSVEPYKEAAKKMIDLERNLRASGISVTCIDLGGGFGVGEINNRPKADVFAETCAWLAENAGDVRFGFQPGRILVARAGLLLTRVLYRKRSHVIVDAGMTELIRPALYGAVHGVAHIGGHPAGKGDMDVVGPVCESADYLAKGVELDATPGEIVAVFDAGAYARSMAMEYNGRIKACEVLVKDGVDALIRSRQSPEEVMSPEDDLGSGAIG